MEDNLYKILLIHFKKKEFNKILHIFFNDENTFEDFSEKSICLIALSYFYSKKTFEAKKLLLRFIRTKGKSFDCLYNLAFINFSAGFFWKAYTSIRVASKIKSDHLNCLFLKAKIEDCINLKSKFEKTFNKILSFQEKIFDLQFCNLLEEFLILKEYHIFLVKVIELRLKKNFKKKNDNYLLGLCYYYLGNYKISALYLNYIIQQNSDKKFLENSYLLLGEIEKYSGNIKNAVSFYKKCLDENPINAEAMRCLSHTVSLKNKDNIKHKILNSKSHIISSTDKINQMHYFYSLAKIAQDESDLEKAVTYARRANDIREKYINTREFRLFFQNISEGICNHNNRNKALNFTENCKVDSIFIIGLPRSGSTLLEQILARTNQIQNLGEVNYLQSALKNCFTNLNDKDFLKELSKADHSKFAKIKENYFKNFDKENKIFSDKNLFNFLYSGLLPSIFENPLILVCERDLRDVFLSIFFNYFSNKNFYFAYSETEIINFFEIYLKSIQNLLAHFPKNIIFIKYENVVLNTKQELSSLFQKLGIGWKDEFVKFYENKSFVNTASSSQVRNKIYKTSIDKWSDYQVFFDDSFKKISNLMTKYSHCSASTI